MDDNIIIIDALHAAHFGEGGLLEGWEPETPTWSPRESRLYQRVNSPHCEEMNIGSLPDGRLAVIGLYGEPFAVEKKGTAQCEVCWGPEAPQERCSSCGRQACEECIACHTCLWCEWHRR